MVVNSFQQIEPIPFPDVPPEVLSQPDIPSQIQEMREWFKAWRDSDHTVRDYRKYFKPVLCYLEGAWTTKQGKFDFTRRIFLVRITERFKLQKVF